MNDTGTSSWFPKPYADFVQRLRVVCGFLLLAAFAWFSHPTWVSLAFGLPISVAGLLLRAWATGHLAKDAQLATSGPYAYIRNPLYMGTLLAATGVVIGCRSVTLAIFAAVIFLGVYLPAVEQEEQHLRKIFPSYAAYADRVHRFIPGLRWNGPSEKFSWARYRKNQEYKAGLGFLLAVAWMVWRCWMNENVT